jgi:hypothetical protein
MTTAVDMRAFSLPKKYPEHTSARVFHIRLLCSSRSIDAVAAMLFGCPGNGVSRGIVECRTIDGKDICFQLFMDSSRPEFRWHNHKVPAFCGIKVPEHRNSVAILGFHHEHVSLWV